MRLSKLPAMPRLLLTNRVFTKNTLVLFAISTVGNILGYIYLIFVGRALEPQSFGTFGALYGIFYIFCLLGDSLRISIAHQITSLTVQIGALAALRVILAPLVKFLAMGLIIIFALAISSKPIASFFQMETAGPILVLTATLISALFLSILLGVCQGLQKYLKLAVLGYLAPQSLKLIFVLLFVWLGWGLTGAIGSLLVSNIITIISGLLLLRLAVPSFQNDTGVRVSLRSLTSAFLLIGIVISLPTSGDVMLVTHYFTPHEAGIYNAVATMGKVILFLPVAISLVMLPQVSQQHAAGNGTIEVLVRSLVYVIIISGLAVLLYWLLPDFIIGVFLGEQYSAAAAYLGWYGTAMLLFAANYLLVQYYLAVSNRPAVLTAVFITLSQVVAIVLAHSSTWYIIIILLMGNLILLILNIIPLLKSKEKQGLH